jgi:hypothetical protein
MGLFRREVPLDSLTHARQQRNNDDTPKCPPHDW